MLPAILKQAHTRFSNFDKIKCGMPYDELKIYQIMRPLTSRF